MDIRQSIISFIGKVWSYNENPHVFAVTAHQCTFHHLSPISTRVKLYCFKRLHSMYFKCYIINSAVIYFMFVHSNAMCRIQKLSISFNRYLDFLQESYVRVVYSFFKFHIEYYICINSISLSSL